MIIPIILFILIILAIAMLIMFSVYILLPSINIQEDKSDDPVIPQKTKKNICFNDEISKTESKAVVLCSCNKTLSLKHTKFNESYTCFMVKNSLGTGSDCPFACIGLGDCMKICPQMAIIIENNTALVTDNCCGCGKCIEVCPQNLIKLIPASQKTIVLCKNDNQEYTSCSEIQKEKNIELYEKKDFKIYSKCYKIIKNIKHSFFR